MGNLLPGVQTNRLDLGLVEAVWMLSPALSPVCCPRENPLPPESLDLNSTPEEQVPAMPAISPSAATSPSLTLAFLFCASGRLWYGVESFGQFFLFHTERSLGYEGTSVVFVFVFCSVGHYATYFLSVNLFFPSKRNTTESLAMISIGKRPSNLSPVSFCRWTNSNNHESMQERRSLMAAIDSITPNSKAGSLNSHPLQRLMQDFHIPIIQCNYLLLPSSLALSHAYLGPPPLN